MSLNIGWPEGLYLALNMLGLIAMADNTKQTVVALAMWVFITLPLLWWGGFFA